MTRFVSYAVEIDAVLYGGVTEQSIDTGIEVQSEVTAGGKAPQFGEINVMRPGGQFTSHNIAALLTKLGSEGFCMKLADVETVTAKFGLWKLSRTDCGALTAGLVHTRLVIPNGIVVPRTLTVQQGQRAALTCEVFGTYDGTNDPIIVQASQAAPDAITDVIGYHIGAVSVAGVAIDKITQISIDFGIEVVPEYDDGESFPASLHIARVQPIVTIDTHDVSKFGGSNLPLRGKLGTHANTTIKLRKRDIGTSAFVTDAEHAEFSIGGVASVRQAASSSGTNPHAMQIVITSLDDGTNAMIDMDFEAAL